MHLIVCVDDHNGMLFHRRRLSKDSVVIDQILRLCGREKLWIGACSRDLFAQSENLYVDEDFLELADANAYCFVEDRDLSGCIDRVRTVTVFKWNRRYPSDLQFPWQLYEGRWRLLSTQTFPGTSHREITQEVYAL